jgi:hypothetical protein
MTTTGSVCVRDQGDGVTMLTALILEFNHNGFGSFLDLRVLYHRHTAWVVQEGGRWPQATRCFRSACRFKGSNPQSVEGQGMSDPSDT